MNMNSILKWVGIVIVVLGFGTGIVHRFMHPDMTDIRWIINYWYIELLALVSSGIGLWIWYRNAE